MTLFLASKQINFGIGSVAMAAMGMRSLWQSVFEGKL